MKAKAICLMAALFLCAALTGCKSNTPAKASPSPSAAVSPTTSPMPSTPAVTDPVNENETDRNDETSNGTVISPQIGGEDEILDPEDGMITDNPK